MLCALAACGGNGSGDKTDGDDATTIAKPVPTSAAASCPDPASNPVEFPPDLANTGIEQAQGAVPGTFAASPTGAATYTIPIVVPPGRAGMEPHLAIAYDSNAGEGELGMGFAMSGFGAVTRCPKTLEPDGENRGVRFDEGDNLCLNGARLISTAGGGGIDPITGDTILEYRTVPDSFAKVVQHYPVGWTATKGPQRIEVFTKAGTIETYGGTSDSRETVRGGVVDMWWISRTADRRGNAVDYSYLNTLDPTGTMTIVHVPTSIAYTSHPTQDASKLVEFDYTDRPNPRTMFRGGAPRLAAKRLRTIRTASGGQPVRSYWLDYAVGDRSQRGLLHAVTECVGASQSSCKVPTTFQWNSGPESTIMYNHGIVAPSFSPDRQTQRWLHDVTGDGLPDIVYSRINDDDRNEWRVAVNDGTGGFATDVLWFTFPGEIDWPYDQLWRAQWTDYNHDGRSDVLLDSVAATLAGMPTRLLLLATPDHSFELIDTGTARIDPGDESQELRSEVRFMDVDGDGGDDLVECADATLSHPTWAVYRWSPTLGGLAPAKHTIPPMDGIPCVDMNRSWVNFVDIDGDGVREIIAWPRSGGNVYHAYAYVNGGWTDRTLSLRVQHSARRLHFLDMNGDGLAEALYTGVGQGVDGGQHAVNDQVFVPAQHPEITLPWSWRSDMVDVHWLLDQPATASDLPVRADNLGGDFASIDPWFGSSNTFASRPISGGDYTDRFADQAQVLDWNDDGLQDLYVPMNHGDPDAPEDVTTCWVVWQSDGHGGFTLVRPRPCIPYFADTGSPFIPLLEPVVADLNGDGRDDLFTGAGPSSNPFLFFPRLSAGPHDQLVGIVDGTNPLSADDPAVVPNVAITYDALIDRSYPLAGTQSMADAVTYLPRFEDGNECGYPRACLLGSRQVVKRYAFNNGKNALRTFGVQYRDGRVDLRGKRGLGFSSRVVRDLDTGVGTAQFYDNITFDGLHQSYPYAGVAKTTWSWVPAKHEPWIFRADFTTSVLSTINTADGQSYFVDPTVTHSWGETYMNAPGPHYYMITDYLFDSGGDAVDERWTTRGVDAYGNLLEHRTVVPMADVKDTTIRTADIDTTRWLVGRIDSETACSAAANLTQCRRTTTTFDDFGAPETVTRDDGGDPTAGLAVTFKRDDFGHVVYTTSVGAGAPTRTSCTSYDATGTFPFAAGNSLGHVTFSKYDGGLGVVRASVDANKLASQWGYDGFGNVTQSIDTNGVATTVTRSRQKDGGPGGLWWRNHTWSTTEHGAESETIAEPGGRTLRVRRRGPAISTCFLGACTTNPWFAQDTSYDAMGNVDSVSTSYLETILPPFRHYTTYVRDHAGRVYKETSPNGRVTTTDHFVGTTYQATAIGTDDGTGQIWSYYDAAGRLARTTDAHLESTDYTYGPFGTPIGVTLPDGTGTSTTFDAWGRRVAHTNADRGTTTATFDGFDQLRTTVDAAERTTTREYDQLGREVSTIQHEAGVTTWATWAFDTAPFGIGRFAASNTSSGVSTALTYTSLGQPESITTTIAGVTFVGGTRYDAYGYISESSYPSALGLGLRLGYDRDVRGNVLAVRDLDSDHVLWTAAELDRRGANSHGVFDNNLQSWRTRYDDSGALEHVWTTLGGETLQDFQLSYDERLRTTRRSKLIMGMSKVEAFDYDKLDRLTCTYFGAGEIVNGEQVCDQAIAYDAVGNITSKSGLGAYSYAAQHPHAVETAGGLTFTYDNVGNQLTRAGLTTTAVTYTPFDLPMTYSVDDSVVAQFTYGADQQRVRKLTTASDTRYVGTLTQQVIDLATMDVREDFYVPVVGATIIVTRRPAQPESRSYALLDQLGSTDVVVGPTGVERRSYDAWGQRRSPQWDGNDAGPFLSQPTIGFTGQEAEDEVGLINMQGRIYDPLTARFLSTDPHVAVPTSAQSWNPYSYVLNNPLLFTDPTGFDPIRASGGSITPLSTPAERSQVNNRAERAHWAATGGKHQVSTSTSSTIDGAGNHVDVPSSAPTLPKVSYSAADAIVGIGDNVWNQGGSYAGILNAVASWTDSDSVRELATFTQELIALGTAVRDSQRTESELAGARGTEGFVTAVQIVLTAKSGIDLLTAPRFAVPTVVSIAREEARLAARINMLRDGIHPDTGLALMPESVAWETNRFYGTPRYQPMEELQVQLGAEKGILARLRQERLPASDAAAPAGGAGSAPAGGGSAPTARTKK